jgi:hypothetical protein
MVTSTNNGLKINMCGRFTLDPTTKFFERFKIDNRLDGLTARYNASSLSI